MNRGMDYCVSFSFTHPSSLHLEVKFMKKNQLCTIVSTWRKQVPITYESLGLLQQNKDFQTPLEQANKMIPRFLLLHPSFTKKEMFKKFTEFFNNMQICTQCIQCLYCKFRLVRLCPVLPDPVTFVNHKSTVNANNMVLKAQNPKYNIKATLCTYQHIINITQKDKVRF